MRAVPRSAIKEAEDDEVPVSLFDKLSVDKEDEKPPIVDRKAMNREEFNQLVKDHGPRADNPYPNYIVMDHESGKLHADADAEIIRLDHCSFVPMPTHSLSDDLQEQHLKIAIEEFEKLSQNPLFVSFPIPTPALLIRLSSRPGLRDLEKIDEAKRALCDKFKSWVDGRSQVSEEEYEKERRSILQNYMHLEFQAVDFPNKRDSYEHKGWDRYSTTAEVSVQYMRAKKMIEMTNGFSRFDPELSRVTQIYIAQANTIFEKEIVDLGQTINRYLVDDIDSLTRQLAVHGEIYRLDEVNPQMIEAACMLFTIGMIRLLERWILYVAGVVGREFMDYHCIPDYSENMFLHDWNIQERCAVENRNVFLRRMKEECEKWRNLPSDQPNISRSLIQWPSTIGPETIQFPPAIFSKSMCASLACALAYFRAEDRNWFGLSVNVSQVANLYHGTSTFREGDFNVKQCFWIEGEENPVPLWSTISSVEKDLQCVDLFVPNDEVKMLPYIDQSSEVQWGEPEPSILHYDQPGETIHCAS